jgi:hypothetical protein
VLRFDPEKFRMPADAVLALFPPASLGEIDAVKAIAKDAMPILIVAAQDDIVDDARQIARRSGRTPGS